MDRFNEANRALWNVWTEQHKDSEFYAMAAFKEGRSTLRPIEVAELGHVAGKSLLHLQCHFGLDTLSWARQGAIATGVDLSDESIALARSLSAETGIPATFVCSDVLSLPTRLTGQFDIVFTSYGVLHWLRDLDRWAEVIVHFLKPGGIFYIVEDHPFMRVFDAATSPLKVDNPYFFEPDPFHMQMRGSYAAAATEESPLLDLYMWDHSLGEIVTALVGAGLHLDFLHEFPFHLRAKFPDMVQGEDGMWRLTREHNMVPLLFSLQAHKPI